MVKYFEDLTYVQVKTASRSPSAIQIAELEGWSKSGKQSLYQEGYEYNRKITVEWKTLLKH